MGQMRVNEKPFRFLQASGDKKFVYFYGGAGSSKSWTIGQFLLSQKLYKEQGIGILALRRTKPEVKDSCLRVVLNQLREAELPYEENKTHSTITAPNGNNFYFDGVDDVIKKKSIEGINYIWLEETTEFTHREWLQLKLRNRAHNLNKGAVNQIYHSFNPEDPVGNAWLKDLVDNAPIDPDSAVMKLNHGSNPFLDPEARANIEALATEDEEFNKIYRLGEWATPTFIIYTNWDIVEDFPSCDEVGYGLDFGYVNPSALIRVGVKDQKDVYVDEVLYRSGMHNKELIAQMKQLIPSRESVIIADSAEPAYIDEIAEAEFNVHPTEKVTGQGGKSFVATGIDRCKRVRIHITKRSTHIIEEIRGYKWKVDKDDHVLNEPLKYKDHAMDAIRYCLGGQPEQDAWIKEIGQYAY